MKTFQGVSRRCSRIPVILGVAVVGASLAHTPRGLASPPLPSSLELARRVAILAGELAVDPALMQAAQRHAHDLLEGPGRGDRNVLQRAVAAEGLADPHVLPLALVGRDRPSMVATLIGLVRERARPKDYTHAGAAWAQRGPDHFALVALFSRRLVELSPLPSVATAPAHALRGRAPEDLELSALTLGPCSEECPATSHVLPVERTGTRLRVVVPLDRGPGRYIAELLATTERGPETAALWSFWVGVLPASKPPPPAERWGEEEVLAALTAMRVRFDLAPLDPSPALDRAAHEHAHAVCDRMIAAHVLPGGGGPGLRATRAGYRGRVTENVAIAAVAEQAHRNFMESPSHRANVLDPTARHVGVGIAERGPRPGERAATCVVELFGLAQSGR